MNRRSLFPRTLAALTGGLIAKDLPATAPKLKAPIASSSLSALDKLFAQDAERITCAMAARRKEMRDLILHGESFREADEFDVLPKGMGYSFSTKNEQVYGEHIENGRWVKDSASSSQPAA